jgi:hypothetical protein
VGQSIGLALMAFVLVGALETFIDRKFPNAKANWDAMATWKKISISFVVIVASIFLFLYAMMEVARLLSR